jgi:hypothetical protein
MTTIFILGLVLGWFGHLLLSKLRAPNKSAPAWSLVVRESEEAIETVRLEEV